MARCGDVLVLYDATAARQPKARMFVCLDPEQGWCARIVTRQPRRHPVMMDPRDHPFLDHHSYIETGMPVEFLDDELESSRSVGRISASVAHRIVEAWQRSEVVPPQARDAVIARVRSEFKIA